MLSRRIVVSAARQLAYAPRQPALLVVALPRRCYAAKGGDPEPKLHPLSEPIPGELDPRFGDLPPWNVPAINRQRLTETPVEPYYDKQGRRYYGEPLSEEDEVLSVFSYDVHDHVTLPFALKWFFGFAAAFTGVCYLIIYSSPGKIAVPRTFPYNGLERELGGPNNAAPKEEIKGNGTEEDVE